MATSDKTFGAFIEERAAARPLMALTADLYLSVVKVAFGSDPLAQRTLRSIDAHDLKSLARGIAAAEESGRIQSGLAWLLHDFVLEVLAEGLPKSDLDGLRAVPEPVAPDRWSRRLRP